MSYLDLYFLIYTNSPAYTGDYDIFIALLIKVLSVGWMTLVCFWLIKGGVLYCWISLGDDSDPVKGTEKSGGC